MSEGFTNSKVVFIASIHHTDIDTQHYDLTLEMQILNDCEDLSESSGAISTFKLYNVVTPALNDPSITISRSQLPSTCYRWRWISEDRALYSQCKAATPWYEEPLF